MPKPEELVRGAQHVLVICHISPDGDAIGSLLGLGHALTRLGKQVTLACADGVPKEFRYLSGWEGVVRRPRGDFDLVIGLDASDMSRLGDAYDAARWGHVPLLNIDHHVTNVNFGSVNWVDPSFASASQMVLELIDCLGVPITPEIAVCILNGVVTDTRGFRTQNTDLASLQAAVRLVSAGANLYEVAFRTLEQRPFATLRIWGEVLSRAKLENEIVWASVPAEQMAGTELSAGALSGLVGFLSGTQEAKVAVLFTGKEQGQVEVSLRSGPGVDVSRLALAMGGGGHPGAAGFTQKGTLDQVESVTLNELRALLSGEKYGDDRPT
jgi:phosphoesterase RecJ-like protein